ncbi:carotenoid isomerooxygenase-like [Corticium candelabrum]|uniref:carotenoid isomerooxygenase-like n=1 Tax=Corticium candelabrum TaxID=121492 RepID=UPI002E26C415|nr:carotenoid isomerooxygenase-like [Corticium candelabrum]
MSPRRVFMFLSFLHFCSLLLTDLCVHASNRAALGFQPLPWDFYAHETVNVKGLPDWLRGTLYRIGPAIWTQRPDDQHWFYGLGFLQSFQFSPDENHLEYTAQFVKSSEYNQSHPNFSDESSATFSPNTGVCIRRVKSDDATHLLANTGASLSNEFDYRSLDSVETPFMYDDMMATVLAKAPSHAQTDLDGNIVHFLQVPEPAVYYYIYTIPYGSRTRKFVGKVALNPTFNTTLFLHSFVITENYVVIPEIPAVSGPEDYRTFRFESSMNTTWRVISRKTAEQVAEFTSEPFFYYHTINAYENDTDDTIIVDLIGYPNMTSLVDMYLENIIDKPELLRNSACANRMMRFVLPMRKTSSAIIPRILSEVWGTELPTIRDTTHATRAYTYVYAVAYTDPHASDFLDSIVKVDVLNGKYKRWHEPGCYPGEPIFVASPNSASEDDGIVLSLVLDVNAKTSFLLTLNAKSMEVMAKAYLPHATPFGFHGRYYRDL